jgi:hypothetical protein
VQEDGAAGSAPRTGEIVVEHDDDVVKAVGSPETFVPGPEGQAYLSIVESVGRIVAPTGIGAERNGRQAGRRAADAVGPVEDGDQGEPPGRRRAVTFALPPVDAAPPEGAGQAEASGNDKATAPVGRNRRNHDPSKSPSAVHLIPPEIARLPPSACTGGRLGSTPLTVFSKRNPED